MVLEEGRTFSLHIFPNAVFRPVMMYSLYNIENLVLFLCILCDRLYIFGIEILRPFTEAFALQISCCG